MQRSMFLIVANNKDSTMFWLPCFFSSPKQILEVEFSKNDTKGSAYNTLRSNLNRCNFIRNSIAHNCLFREKWEKKLDILVCCKSPPLKTATYSSLRAPLFLTLKISRLMSTVAIHLLYGYIF